MNERITTSETESLDIPTKKQLKRLKMVVTDWIRTYHTEAAGHSKDKEALPQETLNHLQHASRLINDLSDYIERNHSIPDSWKDMSGLDEDDAVIPLLKLSEAGEWEIELATDLDPQQFCEELGLVEPKEIAAEVEPDDEEISDTLEMIRSRMPSGQQARYDPTPEKPKATQQATDRPNPYANVTFGKSKAPTKKRAGWNLFGRK